MSVFGHNHGNIKSKIGWISCVLTISLAILTNFLYGRYVENWNILWDRSLVQTGLQTLRQNPDLMTALDSQNQAELFRTLTERQNEAVKESEHLLTLFRAYQWTGILALIVSLFTPFCRPRWLAFISIPIGLFALRLSFSVIGI